MADAYFRRPPDEHWIEVDGDYVLACRIENAPKPEWQKLLGKEFPQGQVPLAVYVDRGSMARHGTNGTRQPGDMPVERDYRISHAEGIARKLRGDRGQWLKWMAAERHQDRVDKARKFHPRMIDEKPSDFLTPDERARFIALAKEAMAAICHLTTFLPMTQIMAPKWATRLCEMIEREMVSIEDYGKATSQQIVAEKRALGAQGVEEIDEQRIDKLQRRRQGLLFQYYHCQLLLRAFTEQHDEVTLEYDTMAMALTGGVGQREGIRGYIRLRDRVEKRKRDERQHEAAVLTQLRMMETKSEQEYRRWLLDRTTFKPRHGQPTLAGEGNDVARPMSAGEIDGSEE